MADKELWLKNNTGSDVHLSDLGVKVSMGKTINVYAYNPYLTADKVKLSMESGSLSKRLEAKLLSVVGGPVKIAPHTINHIESSTNVVEVVKTKTAVVIDTKEMDVLDDDDLGDIADYGLGDLEENVSQVKTDDGSVVVEQKQDPVEDVVPETITKPEKIADSTISQQSIVVMTEQVDSTTDPVGDISDDLADQKPFVVVNAPKPVEQPKQEKDPGVKNTVSVDESGAVIVQGVEGEAQEDEQEEFDTQVATRDETGAIVMKLKEVKSDTADK